MATIGQIVYNLEDYNGSGGFLSTSNDRPSEVISGCPDDESYKEKKVKIFDRNLVEMYSSRKFSKLGIQAPPGTKILMNSNKHIMVGRTGVYELDENIIITSLTFLRPKNYILDEVATDRSFALGVKGFEDAENERVNNLKILDNEYNNKPKVKIYWDQYTVIQTQYQVSYEEANFNYSQGLNGIYILPTDLNSRIEIFNSKQEFPSIKENIDPSHIFTATDIKESFRWDEVLEEYVSLKKYYGSKNLYDENDNYVDLYNIIIDFIY